MKAKFLFFLAVIAIAAKATPPVDEGKSIFSTRCAGCHNVNKIITGPALAGVEQRHSLDWIVNFVHSSQTLIKGGDKDAVALFAKFNSIPMPDHKDLSDAQIKNIVEYIKTEAKAGGSEKAPFARPYSLRPNYVPLGSGDTGFFMTVIALVVLLIGVLLFAVQVKSYERDLKGKIE